MWSRPALPNICGAGGDCLRVADLEHPHRVLVERVGAVGVLDPEAARLHLLEAERQRAVGDPALDRLAGQEQRRGAGRAVVVDVDDRDPGQAELVERPLAVGRVAVAVAGVGLLDVLVGNAGVGERLLPRLLGPVRVVALLGAGLLELGHPDPDDERAVAQLLAPPRCLADWPESTVPAPRFRPNQFPGLGQSRRPGRRSGCPARCRWRARRPPEGGLAEGAADHHDVGGDRRREEGVLDGEQAEAEGGGDGQHRADRPGRCRRRPRRPRWRGSGRARCRSRAGPGGGRSRRVRVASRRGSSAGSSSRGRPCRAAGRRRPRRRGRRRSGSRGGRSASSRVRFERRAASAAAGAPGLFRLVGGAVERDPDEQRPGDLREGAEGPVGERRPGVGSRQEQALGDQHRQRDREADDRQPQRDAEAVAGEGAEQAEGEDRGRRGLAAEDAERGGDADQRRARRLPAGAGRAGASIPGKPLTRAPVAIAPGLAVSKPSSRTSRRPIGTESRKPRRIAGPGSRGADREERRGAQPAGGPGGVEERLRASGGTAPRVRVT